VRAAKFVRRTGRAYGGTGLSEDASGVGGVTPPTVSRLRGDLISASIPLVMVARASPAARPQAAEAVNSLASASDCKLFVPKIIESVARKLLKSVGLQRIANP
jgi:hypothetical protein